MVLAQQVLENMLKNIPHKFPSHYGSRSTGGRDVSLDSLGRFHPTMVLAQRILERWVREMRNSFHPTMVLAQLILVEDTKRIKGFHPTMVLAQPQEHERRHQNSTVSIPLWFSLNWESYSGYRFVYFVSIPLWFSLNLIAKPFCKSKSIVSIPLWFSLNEIGKDGICRAK